MHSELSSRDHRVLWHPCSQMKDYENFKPIEIKAAKGCYLELNNGKKVIDAISSWWCKSLGHNHPRLKKALFTQAEKFEHVIFTNTTHDIIVELAEELLTLAPHMGKVFFASDGSSAVEIALKMSLHSRLQTGEPEKKRILAFANGYHGETMGALSVSDVGIYREPYHAHLWNIQFISPIPYVNTIADPLWTDCHVHWEMVEKELNAIAHEITAIIFEPLVQAAGGMQIYSQDFLRHLSRFAKKHGIHLIADEIMTGFGRTGKMLAIDYADISPDFICLGKGLTSGWLPLSALLTTDPIYDLFYGEYDPLKTFLHSHTQSGNALSAAIALEVMKIFKEENICEEAINLGKKMYHAMHAVATETKVLKNVRGIGAMVAADLICEEGRYGFKVYQEATALGALLRPLGNTIYWVPPLIMDDQSLNELQDITAKAITKVMG